MIKIADEIFGKYPDFPEHMNELGKFVYYRTYSRWIPELNRRETWKETVRRAVEYNIGLSAEHLTKIGYPINEKELHDEAALLFDNIFNLKQALSGRTFWVGSSDKNSVARKYPLANFNCSFLNISKWEDLGDLMYLLLVGTGVGFKCTMEMAEKLAPIRNNVKLENIPYTPSPKEFRHDDTVFKETETGIITISVGDSKEGWVQALVTYLTILTKPEYDHIHTVQLFYNLVRPKGERLKTFGGTASGAEPLIEMFTNIDRIVKGKLDDSLAPWEQLENGYVKVRPIAILDIGNLIGNNVVVGGVRRTAEIFLMSANDYESMFAKYGINGLWGEDAFTRHERIKTQLVDLNIPIPNWFDTVGIRHYDVYLTNGDKETFTNIETAKQFAYEMGIDNYIPFAYNNGRPHHHRRMSNNSIAFEEKPSKEHLHLVFEMMQGEGEPGFINMEQGHKRRPAFEGMNPCAEILLDSYNVCNLTTVNLVEFAKTGELNRFELEMAQRLSARAGLRMTLVDLELPHWDAIQKRDRLLGTSLTGVKDAIALLKYTPEQETELLNWLGDIARDEADKYAKEMRIPSPLLVTTVKPEGTLSQVFGGVSSGLHYSHSPYYIRRIRINAHDPLVKVAMSLGWNVNPEVGQDWLNARTLVIDFPIYSGADKTKDDVYAPEQFDTYFKFQSEYTEHNSSNTIHIRPDEWQYAEDRIYEQWDEFMAVSFLSYDGGSYQLAPYEAITKEQYEELRSNMKAFDPSLLLEFESSESELDIGNDGCEGGICPVR